MVSFFGGEKLYKWSNPFATQVITKKEYEQFHTNSIPQFHINHFETNLSLAFANHKMQRIDGKQHEPIRGHSLFFSADQLEIQVIHRIYQVSFSK